VLNEAHLDKVRCAFATKSPGGEMSRRQGFVGVWTYLRVERWDKGKARQGLELAAPDPALSEGEAPDPKTTKAA
jgi:hypothetical protein